MLNPKIWISRNIVSTCDWITHVDWKIENFKVPRLMTTNRPVANVYSESGETSISTVPLPAVFSAPIRIDVVRSVHTGMRKNKRQAYAVNVKAGMQHSAESWGTGRAVARIPRVSGGGTMRSGQAAFGNMCRKGRMFAPTKVWRRWHVHVNVNEKRYAVASAIAASGIVPLVMARGHRIENIKEVPIVVGNGIESLTKSKAAISFLKAIKVHGDVEKVIETKTTRAGRGKMRGRRYKQRKGPLVVYQNDKGLVKAFCNVPGVEVCQVSRLNLLQLAPGGHVGRLIIWTEAAFKALDSIFGTFTKSSDQKTGYTLPTNIIFNSDIQRIIKSDEIQAVVNKTQSISKRPYTQKKNPLKNKHKMIALNPYAQTVKRNEILSSLKKKAVSKSVKKSTKKPLKASEQFKKVLKSSMQ
eukprot:NODE_475_length_8011_cov_0.074065.p2 type:complete len:412 gc:universal NODE_475_length_8011_cov_0.074065:1387-2622(+)